MGVLTGDLLLFLLAHDIITIKICTKDGVVMYASICLNNGQSYYSLVFGVYLDPAADHDLGNSWNRYFLVLNQQKTKLVRQWQFKRNTRNIIKQVVVLDSACEDWLFDESGCGGVAFLADTDHSSREVDLPPALLARCIALDAAYHYEEYPEIKTQKDIETLMDAVGYFHDASIEKLVENSDGSLYVLFTGIWGCALEVWFSGDVSYNTDGRDPEHFDPYWLEAAVLLDGGYVYLVDDEVNTVADIGEGYCWFKARKMKYHIIPE